MPKSAAWPGSMTVEGVPGAARDGSRDSAASLGSADSNGSLEDLSVEERECLMFLEETIESLEAEEEHASSSIPASPTLEVSPSWSLEPPDWEDDGGPDVEVFGDPIPPALNTEHTGCVILSHNPGADVSPLKVTQGNADLPNNPRSTAGRQNHQDQNSVPSEVSLELIPPPLDFRDDPSEQKHPVTKGPLTNDDLQELRKRAGLKKSPPVTPDPKGKLLLPEQTLNGSMPSSPTEVAPLQELGEQKSIPPMVAPKPKKLPSNIILKSHKTPGSSQDSASPTNCASTSPSERVAIDPQKVRMEALRKIGLLKANAAESGVTHSPGHSPKSYRSFQLPTPPISPSFSRPADGNIVPASSSAFKELHEARDKPSLAGGQQEQVNMWKSVNFTGVKSASLERNLSGPSRQQASRGSFSSFLGPSRSFSSGSPSSERDSRSRPVSLSSHDLAADIPLPNTNAKAPEGRNGERVAPQHAAGPPKLLRSQGVSVVISPHGDVGEDRRAALRKLGLLKD